MYVAGATERATDRRWTARATDDEETFLPVLLRPFFFTLRVRYQYYHNFTFVIGWHRASMTCSLFFFFLRLSLFLLDFQSFFGLYFFHRFVLFSFLSLYYFLLVPSFFFSFIHYYSLLFSFFSFTGTDSEVRDPHTVRSFLVFVRDPPLLFPEQLSRSPVSNDDRRPLRYVRRMLKWRPARSSVRESRRAERHPMNRDDP